MLNIVQLKGILTYTCKNAKVLEIGISPGFNMNNDTDVQIPLPVEILHKIFQYMNYDSVSKNRQVCRQFADVGGSFLTHGFYKVQERHAQSLKKVKDGLPRRESERRKHHLYPKHDALQGLDTRLSLLKMTYTKYIVAGLCCFIPGKVLDEIFLVLNKINMDSHFTSVTNLLQEVRDISSMAMEHFDDTIAPCLLLTESYTSFPYSLDFNSSISMNNDMDSFFSPTKTPSNIVNHAKVGHSVLKSSLQQRLLKIKVKRLSKKVFLQQKGLSFHKRKVALQSQKIKHLNNTVARQGRLLDEVKTQLLEMSAQMSALRSTVSSEACMPDCACAYINSAKTRLNPSLRGVASPDCTRGSLPVPQSFYAASSNGLLPTFDPEDPGCSGDFEPKKQDVSATTKASSLTRKRKISGSGSCASSNNGRSSTFSTTSKHDRK